jgi:hypothetical protein
VSIAVTSCRLCGFRNESESSTCARCGFRFGTEPTVTGETARKAAPPKRTFDAPRFPQAAILELFPLLAAALGAMTWLVAIALDNGIPLLLWPLYLILFFGSGLGWIHVRRPGIGVAIAGARAVVVLALLWAGLNHVGDNIDCQGTTCSTDHLVPFFSMLAVALAIPVFSAVALVVGALRVSRVGTAVGLS